ncbi:hypothetical protein P8C59_008419 [Phyllachora maydis]|uniref:Uncharacterized protein n=1 Tax=Phyllachora maydis TaxID=1825666 RepID=A0AAD9IBQ8_9PEZI|nr:hypothetical protein P8C59_008419 [Phyllachora maydis]
MITVAETSSRSCEICYKLTASVLITPDNKDFFYVCPQHLKDANFCTPKIDQAAVEARKRREMDEEVARVKKEFEEKQRKKKEKEQDKDKDKEKEKKDKDKEKEEEKEKEKEKEKRKDEQADAKGEDRNGDKQNPNETRHLEPIDEPRVFELKSSFYQQRLSRKRQMELAKRNRERIQDPSFFPSVPRDLP